MDQPLPEVSHPYTYNHILYMKIITHRGCKSPGMVVYINSINSDLSLILTNDGSKERLPVHGSGVK